MLLFGFDGCQERTSPFNVHATMLLASIAPDWREISFPSCIRGKVGMPLIEKRDETEGALSALSFNRRTIGSSSFAALSNMGAIARQGPHHGAQTSTRTGMSL